MWAGFPCVDLSSARANRRNLEGQSSSLIFEAERVVKDLKGLFPERIIRRVVENVASMDKEARDEISALLGLVPFRVDPSQQIPMARPRLCWTDVEVFENEDVQLIPREGYVDLILRGGWPHPSQWLKEGCSQVNPEVIYPTCMKCVPKQKPPYKPAGLDRTDEQTRLRWQEDQFRYPPY